jgi:outer membrane protein assembly factor BamD
VNFRMNMWIRVLTSVVLTFVMSSLLLTGCGGGLKLDGMSAQALFTLGKEKYDKKKYVKATEYFQQIVFNHPGETIVDTAQYYLAMSYVGNRDWVLAEAEFNRLAVNYPSSPYFQNAMFMKTNCLYESVPKHYGLDQHDLDRVVQQLNDFIVDYPESEMLPQATELQLIARTRLARKAWESGVVYHRMGLYEPARIYFQKVIDDFTDTQFAAEATFGLAEMDYKTKKFTEARTKFTNFRTVFPEHQLAVKAGDYIAKIDKEHASPSAQAQNVQTP